jgi:hypothetical protein
MPDGSPVSYIGVPREGIALGDQGLLLTGAGRGAHVKWETGQQRGTITLVDTDDLVPARTRVAAVQVPSDGLDDSLDVGHPSGLGLGHLCALRGPQAVLSALAATQPPDLTAIPAEVRSFAEQRVAAAPTIRHAASQLDEEDGAELVRLTTLALLQQTFGVADG